MKLAKFVLSLLLLSVVVSTQAQNPQEIVVVNGKKYADYMGDIFKVDKPDGTFFYAISLEIPEAIYLIKIDVKIDDYEDVENGLFGDADVDADGGADGDTFPDNDGGNFAGEDDSDE